MTKLSTTFPILSTAKSSESRKRKESSAKANRCKIHAAEARKKRACFIFLSLGGSPIAFSNLKELIMQLFHCLHLQQTKFFFYFFFFISAITNLHATIQ